MAKITLVQQNPIAFDTTDPVVILDHRIDRLTKEIFFTYRVKFSIVSLEILNKAVLLRFSYESPYNVKPNMFKNANIGSTSAVLSTIKNYSIKRNESINVNHTIIAEVIVEYHDMQRGYIDFEVKSTNTGQQQIFAYFLSNDNFVDQTLATYSFENSSIINKYELPYDDFFFKTQQVGLGQQRILISSNDKRIKEFSVTPVNLRGANQSQTDEVLKTYTAKIKNNQAFVDIPDNESITRSYRVSPVSFLTKTQLAQFKEVIVNEDVADNTQCIIYPLSLSSNSVSIKVTSIPRGVIAVDVIRANVTQRDTAFTPIYTQQNVDSNGFTYTDTSLTPYNSYDYKVILEFADGSRRIGASNYNVSPILLDDLVSLESQVISTTVSTISTTCVLNSKVTYKTPSSTTQVLNDLKLLGIDNIFPNEIKNLSTQLDPLIGILVTRTCLSNGIEEKVGIYKPGQISIITQDLTDQVYTLEVCLRAPADIIEEIGTSADFAGTQGQFSIRSPLIASKVLGSNPVKSTGNFTQKFFSRSVLSRGYLAYGKTLPTNMAGIEAGRTGILMSHFIKNAKIAPTIIPNSILSRTDGLIVKWSAKNLDDVVKFEIIDRSGTNVVCNPNKNVSSYCATIKTSDTHVTLKTYTNYGDIITTEFTA